MSIAMPSFSTSTILARKALGMGSKERPDSKGEDVSPLDCVFACSVCATTFSDVYRQQHDTVQGLSDGINPKERLVTRLYLASCCHVICIKHLEGGSGPAFHPAGQHPQAPCPVCVQEGDDSPRQLFSVRGFKERDHDRAIPKCWFITPPMKLEGKGKEMEALRFQYLALTRYSRNITNAYKQAAKDGAEAETKLRSMQELASGEHAKVVELEQELAQLRPLQQQVQKLHRLEARLPAIEHYLKLIPKLAEQNDMMQGRLASLGFSMSLEPIPNFKEPFPLDENGDFIEHTSTAPIETQKTASSHMGRSAHNTGHAGEPEASPSFQPQRPLKRARVDSPAHANNIHAAPSSRDLMPPPAKPLSRMKSIRKIIPAIRNKFTNGQPSSARKSKPVSDPDVQMYDNGQWEDPDRPSSGSERPPTRHGMQPGTPYMSGALPVEEDRQMNMSPELRPDPSIAIHDKGSFTFRAPSSVEMKGHRSGKLPTDASYLRLLDGLGRDTGLELGLEDPRRHHHNEQSNDYQDTQTRHEGQPSNEAPNSQEHWNFGHAFLQQSPVNANPSSAYLHSGHDHVRSDDRTMNDPHDHAFMNPVTPAPTRSQRPVDEVDHVVSPFFGSNNRHSRPFSRSQFAEPEVSSNRSATYQFQRQEPPVASDWCKPRSLNGLSFFEYPVNERNERIEWRRGAKPQEYTTPLPQYRAQNIDSKGFITRPGAGHSPLRNDSTYSSLDRPSFLRQAHTESQTAIPFPPFSRPSHSRVTRLPSAMPSIISCHSPVHGKPQRENLGMVGVRSSQYSRPHITHMGPTKAGGSRGYSSAGRRIIRR